MTHRILVSSYTNEVFALLFNETTGSLTLEGSKTVGFHPSWITSLPDVPNTVITCLEQENGKVVALKYTESGESEIVGEASTGGDYPCSVLAVKDELFVANVCLDLLIRWALKTYLS
jgi:6-phosphogluconolactonase (cycloisomerase 2 family)